MFASTLTPNKVNPHKFLMVLLASLTLISCVTINIYFPAAAAEKAAEQIVDEVLNTANPDNGDTKSQEAAPGGNNSSFYLQQNRSVTVLDQWLLAVIDFVIPRANAAANISIETAKIRAIRSSMEARQSKLQPYYQSGAAGFTNNGMIAVVSAAGLSVKQKSILTNLVNADNADRQNLYKEIAVANGHPEWQADIQKTFAKTWINKIPKGWKYQNAQGQWLTK